MYMKVGCSCYSHYSSPVRAAQSGIAGFPQPNTLGYINNFFHPHTGPIAPGQGFLPLGNLLTSDFGGPYNLSLLSVQENEIKGAPWPMPSDRLLPHQTGFPPNMVSPLAPLPVLLLHGAHSTAAVSHRAMMPLQANKSLVQAYRPMLV